MKIGKVEIRAWETIKMTFSTCREKSGPDWVGARSSGRSEETPGKGKVINSGLTQILHLREKPGFLRIANGKNLNFSLRNPVFLLFRTYARRTQKPGFFVNAIR
jgi:hypothetical protein